MRTRIAISALMVFVATESGFAQSPFQSRLAGAGTCFKLIQISSGQVVEEINSKLCAQRYSPNSTFKIPLALMGFEKGLLTTEDQVIKWDGKKHSRTELNQDQTPRTWMDRSVVWVSQWLTPQLTEPVIQKFLKDFNYGNQDFSGGLSKAWLDSSLKISPDEQITFLSQLWNGTLSLSAATTEKTKKILFIQRLDSGAELYGKTGTGCLSQGCDKKPGLMQGWFVGFLKTKKEAYAFAAYSADQKKHSEPAGPRLRKSVTEAFKTWEPD